MSIRRRGTLILLLDLQPGRLEEVLRRQPTILDELFEALPEAQLIRRRGIQDVASHPFPVVTRLLAEPATKIRLDLVVHDRLAPCGHDAAPGLLVGNIVTSPHSGTVGGWSLPPKR